MKFPKIPEVIQGLPFPLMVSVYFGSTTNRSKRYKWIKSTIENNKSRTLFCVFENIFFVI